MISIARLLQTITNTEHMLKTLEITTRIGCKNMCRYCPQKLLIQQYHKVKGDYIMSFQTFKTCIDKLPKDVRIDFSGMAEPWLNKEATKMLLYAYKSGFGNIAVYTTCVGMTLQDVGKIKNIPYSVFMVHLADADGNAKILITKEYLNVLTAIKNSGIHNIKYMTMGKLHPKLKAQFDGLLKEIPMLSRGGNLDDSIAKVTKRGSIECIAGLQHNVLLPNGDVILCCMDYGLKHKIGNLLTDQYKDLFSSKEMKVVINKLSDTDAGDLICRHCEYAIEAHTKTFRYKIYKKLTNHISKLIN